MPNINTRLAVAKSVGMPLIELEKHIDAALITTANVQVAALEGHRKARLPLLKGQEAFEQLAAATAQLVAARKAVHEAHLILRDVQDHMGLGVIAYGDHGDTPRDDAYIPRSAALTVVNAA